MSHEWNCRCIRCSREWRHMIVLEDDDSDPSPQEAREQRLQEHQVRAVWPALHGWGWGR